MKEIYCANLSGCQMHYLKPKQGKQDKICAFNNCSLSIRSEQIKFDDGRVSNIAVVFIENDDYDED